MRAGGAVTVPAVADLAAVLRRIAQEETREARELARLEERHRRFADVEAPAYERWLRSRLGPAVARVDTLAGELRARRILAGRVRELMELEGLHAREALWVATETGPAAGRAGDRESRAARAARERDEVEARRRARRERKRAERRAARRAARTPAASPAAPGGGDAAARRRLVALYRELARSLHPDSPRLLRTVDPARVRAIWAEVQAAYAMRSLERLLALTTWVATVAATGVDAAPAAGPVRSLAERHERVRALRRASRALERRLAALAAEPAWDFEAAPPARRRKLEQAARRRLAAEQADLEAALAAVDGFLRSIGPPRPPRGARADGASREAPHDAGC